MCYFKNIEVWNFVLKLPSEQKRVVVKSHLGIDFGSFIIEQVQKVYYHMCCLNINYLQPVLQIKIILGTTVLKKAI